MDLERMVIFRAGRSQDGLDHHDPLEVPGGAVLPGGDDRSRQKLLQRPDLPDMSFEMDPAHDDRLSHVDRSGHGMSQNGSMNLLGTETVDAGKQPGPVF